MAGEQYYDVLVFHRSEGCREHLPWRWRVMESTQAPVQTPVEQRLDITAGKKVASATPA